MPTITPKDWGAASHLATNFNLIEVLRAACEVTEVPLTTSGGAVVEWRTRFPLVLAVLDTSIDAHRSLSITVTATQGSSITTPLAAVFAPYSEFGSALPLYAPVLTPDALATDPIALAVKARWRNEDGTNAAVPAHTVIKIHVVEGQMGRLLYAMHAEKARLRAQRRLVVACRSLNSARMNALDRIGADMGVRRFSDEIKAKKVSGKWEVVVAPRGTSGTVKYEPDREYLNRLAIYRPYLKSAKSRLLRILNGDGDATPNGLLSQLGYEGRIELDEDTSNFAVAMHLVQCGGGNERENFLKYIGDTSLVWPADTAANNSRHRARYLPSSTQSDISEARELVRTGFVLSSNDAFAPMLAFGLARVARVCKALSISDTFSVTRSFDASAGSRYELGVGADITVPSGTIVNRIRQQVMSASRIRSNDAVAEALIESLKVAQVPTASEDPEASWLWNVCELQTCHALGNGQMYVSHLPTYGLTIDGDSDVVMGGQKQLTAAYRSPGDGGPSAVLQEVLANADDEWVALTQPNFTVLPQATAQTRLTGAVLIATGSPITGQLTSAGLQAWKNVGASATDSNQRTLALAEGDYAVIDLPAALSAALIAGDAAAGSSLGDLVEIFQRQGLPALVPFVTSGPTVCLVASGVSLPEAGMNLGERRLSGIRWSVVPIGQLMDGMYPVGLTPLSSKCTLHGNSQGLVCVVALGYARRSFTDPYEYRAINEEDELLDIKQYEFLMNVLDHTYPLGIQVNTYELRKFGVDLDGDGVAEPMGASISKTYRKFQVSRLRGHIDDRLTEQ